ncbi:ATP-binding cassette domain-containing protein [Xylophilus rhododendri]|uniref:ATP-binding cassette domain-containing protein n=1 Tax=Xylophilus rhododendri TaxID=2697032 RepID=A0A857JA84_9BURK|nr:oligopeptide/dipeptide ABC transporter ATP-binding protein [Xylophilus rhododendri]QHI99655.1 ATP-binding cassette domain-containing protein [Xylophilus rhododendri]
MNTTIAPVLQVRDLKKHYRVDTGLWSRRSPPVHAVDGISFDIARGETLGLVGESGCGKSTVGKLILRLVDPTAGKLHVAGVRIDGMRASAMRPYRRNMQAIFQDPYSSLNPRMRARELVAEPLRNFGGGDEAAIRQRVATLFEQVGLRPDQMERFAHEFSGGQRQRLVIARAMALEPGLIICDEAVSALDVSVQAQVINLLGDVQKQMGVSYLFISHDLAVIEHLCHRVAVMYLGRIVEITDKRSLFARPLHPYTQALLSAAPVPDPTRKVERIILDGDVPSPIHRPSGCHFHTRCPYAMDRCRVEEPLLREPRAGHRVACHLAS